DHAIFRRKLVILDRRGRVDAAELDRFRTLGFEVNVEMRGPLEVIKTLGNQGVIQVLVEAGPQLAGALLGQGLWDEHLIINNDSFTRLKRRQMFTGLVQEKGKLKRAERESGSGTIFEIETGLGALEQGESVAINGVCLTVESSVDGVARFGLSAETLERTALGEMKIGAPVNVERALKFGDRMGGHWVQGHVDGVGRVLGVSEVDGGAYRRLDFALPEALGKYCVEKGSIAIDGVSLTLNAVLDRAPFTVSVMLVPHTLGATTLGTLTAGSAVNVEVDVLGKYVERLMPWQKK
ncbi:MAG: riboflavin synthase, partial [Bdellovibrionota bacterium]